MEIIEGFYIVISALYTLLIGWLIVGYFRVKSFENNITECQHKFSIVIPFRNEEEHLPKLIESITNLQYQKSHFEVLFVDDDSGDKSVKIIYEIFKNSDINFQILQNIRTSKSPKKDAIQTAISASNFEWIITTDADCIIPNLWLSSFDNFLKENQVNMVAAPIELIGKKSFLNNFQTLDNWSLQTATIGGFGWRLPFLANGANLCFQKSDFESVNGFDGNNTIASGDDIFLLEKFVQNNKKVAYLKSLNATIKTHSELTWKGVINQRIRWASKTKKQQSYISKIIGLIVFGMNFSLILGIALFLVKAINPLYLLSVFLLKFLVDLLAISVHIKTHKEFRKIPFYFLSALIYPFLSVWIVLKSITGSYSWKGRNFDI